MFGSSNPAPSGGEEPLAEEEGREGVVALASAANPPNRDRETAFFGFCVTLLLVVHKVR